MPATSIITTKSAYAVRVSMTVPQVIEPIGALGLQATASAGLHHGVGLSRPVMTSKQAFQRAFKEAGGEIVGRCARR